MILLKKKRFYIKKLNDVIIIKLTSMIIIIKNDFQSISELLEW
jgi:hypothetical protein